MNIKPKKVLLIRAKGRQYKLAAQLVESISTSLAKAGVEVDVDDKGIVYDLAISVGGDGTMMKSVTNLASRDIPTLGINAGGVGFLTTAEASEWECVVKRVIAGEFCLEKRLGIEIQIGSEVVGPIANEVVLRHSSSVATFEVSIGGQVFYPKLMGDGVMVATATGSTGYNTSAGGPILLPGSGNVVVTPLNPMALTTHPLVGQELAEGKTITLNLIESKRDEPVLVIADGVPVGKGLPVGGLVTVRKYKHPLLFATFGLEQYARALTEKKGFAR